jgi:RNA polymerase sigma-70 factor (ECF subfamily)
MGNPTGVMVRLMDDEMSVPATRTRPPTADPKVSEDTVDGFVAAFNEVRAELVSTLFFMLGNYEDAQDAAQEAFLKCWRAQDSVAEIRNYRAWIFRVGLNAAKDLQRNAWYRRARPLAGAALHRGAPGISPVEAASENEDRERLRQALLALRPEEREVYLLRENGTLTYEEIAKLRRCPVGTIKTQMRAALRKLHEAMRRQEM